MKTPRCIGPAGLILAGTLAACDQSPTPEPYRPKGVITTGLADGSGIKVEVELPLFRPDGKWVVYELSTTRGGRPASEELPLIYLAMANQDFDADAPFTGLPTFFTDDGDQVVAAELSAMVAAFEPSGIHSVALSQSATLQWGAVEYALRDVSMAQLRAFLRQANSIVTE
jgi:hypothetical protein